MQPCPTCGPISCLKPSADREHRLRVLVTESKGFSEDAAAQLEQFAELVLADLDRPQLLTAVRPADVLWTRLRHRIDAEVLHAAPRLKAVVSPTTGLNHIDVEEAARRNVVVLSLRGETDFLREVRATAEYTIGLMLALLRRIPAASRCTRAGGWNRDAFWGEELHGKTVGVVGYGRLGQIVARYLSAFDARVLVTDRPRRHLSPAPGATLVDLSDLLTQADIITLHASLTDDNRGFFGRDQFDAMKRGSFFVNTARGELIDEMALLCALKSGHVAGAALDVMTDEQSGDFTSRPLIEYAADHDQLLITPHIGGCTTESVDKTELFMVSRLRELLDRRDAGRE